MERAPRFEREPQPASPEVETELELVGISQDLLFDGNTLTEVEVILQERYYVQPIMARASVRIAADINAGIIDTISRIDDNYSRRENQVIFQIVDSKFDPTATIFY
ncbi:MAG: hypothetical protein NUV98_04955 [Candidatus Roizmanbacteria bacterium]|nr:hypothetical protein [Candidatus Roizmanbacteria bacterium]